MKQEATRPNRKPVKRVGLRNVPLSRLSPWPDNPRKNTDAVRAVTRSILRFGFNVSRFCATRTIISSLATRDWKPRVLSGFQPYQLSDYR